MSETLRQRLEREPGYRPYCLCCNTMTRQTPVIKDGVVVKFWCNPHFREPGIPELGVRGRQGCGVLYNVDEVGQGKAIFVSTRPRGVAETHYHSPNEAEPPTPARYPYDMVMFDDEDAALLAERIEARDKLEGPRLGDFVRFAEGVEVPRLSRDDDSRVGRFVHDWGDDIQWYRDGSFYLCKGGGCSYSGTLNPAIPKSSLTLTDDKEYGSFWFFHHDMAGASRGVYVKAPCRVYEVKQYGDQ